MSVKKEKPAPPVPVEQLSEDTKHLMDVLNSQADLACVVVGAAFLDTALKTLLSEKLLKSSVTDKLLDDRGALGSFSARADLAYCLGIVRKHHYNDLRLVMEIRNQFAHTHLHLAFDDSTVQEKCDRLNEWKVFFHGEKQEPTPEQLSTRAARNKFTLSVIFLSNWLLITALEIKRQPPTVSPTAIEIKHTPIPPPVST